MVLVDAAYRGRGIGTQLMRHAIAWLDQCGVRTVGWMPRPWGARCTKNWALWASTRWPVGKAGGSRGRGRCHWGRCEITWRPIRTWRRSRPSISRRPARRAARCWPGFSPNGPGDAGGLTQGRIPGFSGVRLGGSARQIGPVVALTLRPAWPCWMRRFATTRVRLCFSMCRCPTGRPRSGPRRGGCAFSGSSFAWFAAGRSPIGPKQIWASFGPEKG